jgi:hypothetical protein
MATKVIPIKPLTSWSFSRYSAYNKCPLSFKLANIDKIAEPKNAAMQRGNDIHLMAENYLKGTLTKLPTELKLFAIEFKKLKALYKKKTSGTIVEDNWSFTQDWDRTEWNNWTKCYLRIKLDCAHHEGDGVMIVTDWNTGKFRAEMNEEYMEQLELYALGALVLHPHVKEVRPRLVYLDQGTIYPPEDKPVIYTQADVKRLKAVWAKRVKPMFSDKTFAPKPNRLCQWCFYGQSGKANGGPGICKF